MFEVGDILRHHAASIDERGPWTGVDLEFIEYHPRNGGQSVRVRNPDGAIHHLRADRLRRRDAEHITPAMLDPVTPPATPREFRVGDRVVFTGTISQWHQASGAGRVPIGVGAALNDVVANSTVLTVENVHERHVRCTNGFNYPKIFLAHADSSQAAQPTQPQEPPAIAKVWREKGVAGYCGALTLQYDEERLAYLDTNDLIECEQLEGHYIHRSVRNLAEAGYSWLVSSSSHLAVIGEVLKNLGMSYHKFSYCSHYPQLVVPTEYLRDTEKDFNRVKSYTHKSYYENMQGRHIRSARVFIKDNYPAPVPLFNYFGGPIATPIFLLNSSWCRNNDGGLDSTKGHALGNFIHEMQEVAAHKLTDGPIKIAEGLWMQAVCTMKNPSEGLKASVALMFTDTDTPIQVEVVE